MISWRPDFSHESLYFITTSTYHHKDIFSDKVTKQIVLDHFDCYRRKSQFNLFSFVLMPTHIHFISKFSKSLSMGEFMRNFKSLSSNRISRYLHAIKSKLYIDDGKIWEDDYVAKEIYKTPFLMQKLEYIHQNPCKNPRILAENPEDYPWSSASFYLTDQPCIIPIDDLRDYLMK
jgi:putative transposase